MIGWIQFYWPGVVFTLAQAVVYGLTIWLTATITRWSLRRRHEVQDREELVQTIRSKQMSINHLMREVEAERAESGRLRALLISNTALASQLMQNHEAARAIGEAQG